ncbi:MAG: OmpA family protein [Puia sp.]|nr:OmpA family protein [Puia sp.]
MAGKKCLLFSVLLCLFVSGSFAQVGGSYDVRDSSLIPTKNLAQHNEFLNNAYPFPAKPRNMWELGLQAGYFAVSGDVRSRFGYGGAITARKALGYVFSLRGEFMWGRGYGLNFSPSSGYGKDPAWAQYYNPATQTVFYNYKTDVKELTLQGVITLNNVRFHKTKTGFNLYMFGGLGFAAYDTYVNALDANGNPYNFSTIDQSGLYKDRKTIKKELKALLDKSYETHAEVDHSQPMIGDQPLIPVGVLGIGVQFKLNNKFNLQIEDKYTITKSDLIDGQQWQNNYVGGIATGSQAVAQTRDYDSYNFASIGLNYNIGRKSVEPLWWLNPLDYAYGEINAPRHMKLPKPVLDDADGDGVTDQFDHEPNTPAGCPVDTHGVSLDTDGDGVPDCRDKEKITPTQCQPVDADGVGKCPDPQCCKDLRNALDSGGFGSGRGNCNIGDLPSISFKGRSVTLSKDSKALLASTAEKMRNNPNCKVAVIGYGESSKAAQQLSWDRVNSVINYLVEKEGISSDRFIFRYGQSGGDENTVDLKNGTGEEGPNNVPAPHPNLRKK